MLDEARISETLDGSLVVSTAHSISCRPTPYSQQLVHTLKAVNAFYHPTIPK